MLPFGRKQKGNSAWIWEGPKALSKPRSGALGRAPSQNLEGIKGGRRIATSRML